MLYKYAKRALDIIIAAPLLLISFPFVTLVGLILFYWHRAPLFMWQTREGAYGKPFRILKLRTMYLDAGRRLEQHLNNYPIAKRDFEQNKCLRFDPRIAGPIGKLARQYSIDELPQLWNVMKGDMSMVGPRPLTTEDATDFFPDRVRHARLQVPPGLTGLWQATRTGKRDVVKDMAAKDLVYIQNRSLWLDLKIIFRTMPAVFSGRGLY